MKTAIFRTTAMAEGHPSYAERNGQAVTIVRPLREDEANMLETGPMFRIRFNDGAEVDVFEDELEETAA